MEENPKTPVLKPALIYGLIYGLVSIIISLLLYFIDQSTETWASIVSIVITIAVLIYVLLLYKKEYGKGFISYGRVVGMSTLIGVVAGIMVLVYSLALYSADDAYLQDLKYNSIEKMDKRFEKMDLKYQEKLTDDQYEMYEDRMVDAREKALGKINGMTPASIGIQAVWATVFMNLLLGLIIGIFIKKKADIFQV